MISFPLTQFFKEKKDRSPYIARLRRGFTMIELLVSISIMVLITGLVLGNYKTFSNSAQFVNTAESIVLALRQAQVYGIAAKSNAVVCGGSAFDCVYGVHLDSFAGDLVNPPRNNQVILFADEDVSTPNDAYHYTSTDRIVETITFPPGVTISKLHCNNFGSIVGDCSGSTMDITFRRPNVDAVVADQLPVGVSNPSSPTGYANGVITLTNGVKSAVATTTITGQISLKYYE